MTRLDHLRDKLKRPRIKPLAERNRFVVGVVGILIVTRRRWSPPSPTTRFRSSRAPPTTPPTSPRPAASSPAATCGCRACPSAGSPSIHLEGTKVLVDFTVDDGVELGDRTEAAIKTETVLGTKMLEADAARRRQAHRHDSARADQVALRPAGRAGRPDHDHQRLWTPRSCPRRSPRWRTPSKTPRPT